MFCVSALVSDSFFFLMYNSNSHIFTAAAADAALLFETQKLYQYVKQA